MSLYLGIKVYKGREGKNFNPGFHFTLFFLELPDLPGVLYLDHPQLPDVVDDELQESLWLGAAAVGQGDLDGIDS